MTRQQEKRHDRKCVKIFLVSVMALVVCMIIATTRESIRQQEQEERARKQIIERFKNAEGIGDYTAGVAYALQEVGKIHESGSVTESNTLNDTPMDYGDEIEGFVFYEIPEEYERSGGCLPEEVQKYIYCLCRQEGVRYALILAMIEQESGYRYDCTGDDGESIGYMQIMQKWHEDRMEAVGATDLLDPYQNIRVGVDYMKELIDRYGTIQDALAAYNHGAAGAREYLWSNEIYVYSYNEGIMSRMKEIEEELGQ